MTELERKIIDKILYDPEAMKKAIAFLGLLNSEEEKK